MLRISARLPIALGVAIFVSSACDEPQQNPQGYACDPAVSGQSSCQAGITFAGGVAQPEGSFVPSITGYRTDVLVARSMLPGNGRIGNSMRLIGSSTSHAFLEIGYFALPGVAMNCGANGGGLWYYVTKLEAGVLTTKCVQAVPSTHVGKYATLEIASEGPDATQPTSFKVSITTMNTPLNLCESISCANTLWTAGSGRFATVELAETLLGTSGAQAGAAIFKNNSYQRPNGVFAFQMTDGQILPGNPPFVVVIQPPAVGTSGGTFTTQCCVAPGS